MKTRNQVQQECDHYDSNPANYKGSHKIQIDYEYSDIKMNEAMLYSIAQETGASSYEMFEFFNNLAVKILTLYSTPKHRGRQQFIFYGTYPNSKFNFIISVKKEWYSWNEQLFGMDASGNVVIDYNEDKYKYNSWGTPKAQASDEDLAKIDHYKCTKNFSCNVTIPTRSVSFKKDKVAEILVEKELLGFSALAEPEDPNVVNKRRSINDIDKMIEDANTVSIKKGKKRGTNV